MPQPSERALAFDASTPNAMAVVITAALPVSSSSTGCSMVLSEPRTWAERQKAAVGAKVARMMAPSFSVWLLP